MRRPALPALLGLLLLALPSAPPATSAACPVEEVPGLGPACLRADGLYEVFGAGGESLGFTHGPDPAEPADEAGLISSPIPSLASPRAPQCVSGAAGSYFVQLIYARASNDADRYAEMAPTLRDMTASANGILYEAAQATGGAKADVKVKCVGGTPQVLHVALPTPMASASFSTIVSNLRALGHNDGRVKYWVFYDDAGACSCSGTGHVYNDDRLTSANANNGNQASMFAVSFGTTSTRTWLHELSHNLGAVQLSAPHTTGAGGWHCTDGFDILCYADSGSNGDAYLPASCPLQVYDCNHDDYFDRTPSGYLASHWNLGSSLNRFLQF